MGTIKRRRSSGESKKIRLTVLPGGEEGRGTSDSFDETEELAAKTSLMITIKNEDWGNPAATSALTSLAMYEGRLRHLMERSERNGDLDLDLLDRHVKILGKIMAIIQKHQATKSGKGSIDFRGPQFRDVMVELTRRMQTALEKCGFDADRIQTVLESFAREFEGFEDDMHRRAK